MKLVLNQTLRLTTTAILLHLGLDEPDYIASNVGATEIGALLAYQNPRASVLERPWIVLDKALQFDRFSGFQLGCSMLVTAALRLRLRSLDVAVGCFSRPEDGKKVAPSRYRRVHAWPWAWADKGSYAHVINNLRVSSTPVHSITSVVYYWLVTKTDSSAKRKAKSK